MNGNDIKKTDKFDLIEPIVIEVEPPGFAETPQTREIISFEPIAPVRINIESPAFTELLELLKDGDSPPAVNNYTKSQEYPDIPGIKSLPDIIKEHKEQSERFQKKVEKNVKKKKKSLLSVISDILFYSAILTVFFSILTSGSKSGTPRMFMGYSCFTVLTSSMQDEIPKGSFILVRHIDPQKLEVGDTVTYMRDATTSVTHKIINIYENYENSGARGFQTKGVNNANPDKNIVYAANVVGKVIFSLPVAGAAISSLKANIYIVFIIFGLCIILSFLIRILFTKPERKDNPVKI